MNRIFAFLFLLFCSFSTHAQIPTAKLDSLFWNLEKAQLGSGNIAIMENGKVVYQKFFGMNQLFWTKYRIGSITKVYTATLIYQLIDAKKLALTDPLAKFFPDLPSADRITIAHLLGHRSGLTNFTENTDFDTWKAQPQTHEKLLALIRDRKSEFEPGAMASYNNSNYLLLGFILEKIYGKAYPAILMDKIINQLGLKYTYYGNHSGYKEREAVSYKYFNNKWQPELAVHLDNFNGAGAIISTPSDLCLFITALFDGKLISKKSLDTMKEIRDGYGMGLFPYGNPEHPGLGHNGKTEGFASSLQYYPERKLAIAYCTNGEVYDKTKILDHVFKACFGIPDKIPTFEEVKISNSQLQELTGTYLGQSGMEITNRTENGKLILSLKGQDFELMPIGPMEFRNKPFGFFFNFEKEGKRLLIHDVETTYELNKP